MEEVPLSMPGEVGVKVSGAKGSPPSDAYKVTLDSVCVVVIQCVLAPR